MSLTFRVTGIFILVLAAAVAAFSFGSVSPAGAEGERSAPADVVFSVPDEVIDDFAAIQGDTSRSGGWIPGLPSDLAAALCETFPDQFECICIGVSPDLCKAYLPGFADLELDLTAKLCGTYQCICIDIEPDECVPSPDGRQEMVAVDASVMPAVLESDLLR